jgi:hypothetical protein
LTTSARGSAALGDHELTIVINERRAYISAARTDLHLADFYAEVTAATSLCAGQDEFGILLRAESPADFYRFALSCDGNMRLDRIRGGTASSPLGWTPSASIPRNAPAAILIGVWADGGQFHFYINGAYQITVAAPLIPAGTLGFFARSAGDTAMTVNFRELTVWEVVP